MVRNLCFYCKSENIERVVNEELVICYKCHKWFLCDDIKTKEMV